MNIKMIGLAVGVVVALGGAFVVGSIDPLGMRGAPTAKAKQHAKDAKAAEEEPAEEESGPPKIKTVMYSTKERVVNLADPGGFRYLKTEVVLELVLSAKERKTWEGLKGEAMKKAQEEFALEYAPITPAISDIITTTLGSKKASELLTPEGKAALREDLKLKLEPLFHGRKVQAVHLAQFVVQ